MAKYRAKPVIIDSWSITGIFYEEVKWPDSITIYDLIKNYGITPTSRIAREEPGAAHHISFRISPEFNLVMLTLEGGKIFRTLCDTKFSRRADPSTQSNRFRVATNISIQKESKPKSYNWPLQIQWKLAATGNMIVQYPNGMWTVMDRHHHSLFFDKIDS